MGLVPHSSPPLGLVPQSQPPTCPGTPHRTPLRLHDSSRVPLFLAQSPLGAPIEAFPSLPFAPPMPQLPVLPQVLPSAEEAAALYRELSQNPGISTACLGPDVTTQYGGKYCSLYTGMGWAPGEGGGGGGTSPHPHPHRVVAAGPGAGQEHQVLPAVSALPRRGLYRLCGAWWRLLRDQ